MVWLMSAFSGKAASDRIGPRARTDLAGMDVPRLQAGGGTGGQHPWVPRVVLSPAAEPGRMDRSLLQPLGTAGREEGAAEPAAPTGCPGRALGALAAK